MIEKTIIDKFGTSLHGQLIQPDDADYDDARKVWNGMIDKHPALLIRCADEADVINAVNFAREEKLLVAVRGGGHNVAGFGTCDEGIVIDLSPMKKIEIDAENRTARAQAGLTWGEFDTATQKHKLATTGGLVSTTGIAGFTLGGGFGWLVRKYGLTVDNLLAADMVLANGKQVTVSPDQNPDLFWGVRGGGGNFGVVTAFKFQLHNIGPEVFSGVVFYSVEKARKILQFYRDWTLKMPDELSSMIAFLAAPPEPFVPKHLVGKPMIALAFCYSGSPDEGEEAVKPLRNFIQPEIDLIGMHPYLGLQTMFDASAPRGIHAYWKTENLNDLSDDAINILIEHCAKMSSLSHFSAVHIHHWGGAIERVNQDSTAFAHRDARYVMNIIGLWMENENFDEHIAWTREFSQAMKTFSNGQAYLNFLGDEGSAGVKSAFDETRYQRLVALKNKYDPDNLFRLNQNIKPST